jgi:hypothetical protein
MVDEKKERIKGSFFTMVPDQLVGRLLEKRFQSKGTHSKGSCPPAAACACQLVLRKGKWHEMGAGEEKTRMVVIRQS